MKKVELIKINSPSPIKIDKTIESKKLLNEGKL